MQAAVQVPFHLLGALAAVLAGLQQHRPATVIAVIDCLLEELHESLQHCEPPSHQQSIAHARLLAECYLQHLVPAPLIFYMLYLHIDAGAPSYERCKV